MEIRPLNLLLGKDIIASDGRIINKKKFRSQYRQRVTKCVLRTLLKIPITHNMTMIQPSFISSKWNMAEIFGLKFHLSYLHTPQRFF